VVVLAMVRRRRAPSSTRPEPLPSRRTASVAALIAAALAVAGYLSYAAATGSEVLCGSLTSCEVVQQSRYASLFGVPVAHLGLVGYALIAVAFATTVLARGRAARAAVWTMLWLTLAGTAFSLYLTVLEPFVLGAACLWCLVSAALMALLLLASAGRLGLLGRSSAGDAAGRRRAGRQTRRSHARAHSG
jgi:uncharacterized membrane protein